MIHTVFHYICRAQVQPRYLDRFLKKLHFPLCRPKSFTTACLCRVSFNSDSLTYGFMEGNWKCYSRSIASPSNLPHKISTVSFSSKQHEKCEAPNPSESNIPQKDENEEKLSIFKRFKKMYRDYWYVLVPVHVITSLGWFGGFYYLAKSGVDIKAISDTLGISDHIPDVLKDSSAGQFAVMYTLYKIATPVRYMVTIGGTTISIKYLKEYGYIKPIPPKEKLKEMYEEKKENLKEKRQHIADEIKQKREKFKERRQTLMRERRQQTEK